MKKLLLVYVGLIAIFSVYIYFGYLRGAERSSVDEGGLRGQSEEKYVMVSFLSGMDYWKNCLKGFEDAAEALGVSVEYRGATQFDINEQVTVLEQVIAKKPAGIALSAINSEAIVRAIDKAVDAGIPVVLFDSGVEGSKASSFLGTNNYNAGAAAAEKMAELIGGAGEVGIVSQPNQLNHAERVRGFREAIRGRHPDIRIVAVADGKGDQLVAGQKARELMDGYPDLKGIFVTEANGGVGVGNAVSDYGKEGDIRIISFDTDVITLDMVRGGRISASIAQGTWNMGYWSLLHLFHLRNGLYEQSDGERTELPPLPPHVDTGTTIVTPDNVDRFYAR